MQILKGAPVAAAIRDEIKKELEGCETKPCLAIVRAGRGRNSKMPSIVGSSFMAANSAEKSSIEMSAGNTNNEAS